MIIYEITEIYSQITSIKLFIIVINDTYSIHHLLISIWWFVGRYIIMTFFNDLSIMKYTFFVLFFEFLGYFGSLYNTMRYANSRIELLFFIWIGEIVKQIVIIACLTFDILNCWIEIYFLVKLYNNKGENNGFNSQNVFANLKVK